MLWVAIDEDGTFYLYDEMFIPDLTIAEISDRIHAREGNTEVHRGLIDPNAKYIDKLRGQTMSVQMQFRQNGIQCIEANNKFESGYYRISHLLTPQPVYGDEKNLKPKMFVFKHLKETIMEFESCNWENENKDNHMLDNLKYIVNDNPMRTWKEEEIHELQEEERERQREMNPITGY